MTSRFALLTSALVLAASVGTLAHAETITSFTGSVSASDPTQLGRLSRNGQPQSWTGVEAYPGLVNTAATYHYTTYTFDASDFTGAPYIDVSVYDETDAGQTFLSAYGGSYDPSNKKTNWLGDAGTSGNYFGVDALDFEFVLPSNEALVLVLNTTGGGTLGTGLLSDITVNAYADTDFNDPVPVAATPEPGTLLTTMTGLLGAVGVVRRRFAARA